jgi:hypothetical protein
MRPHETDELDELRKLSRTKDSNLTDRQRERLAYLSLRHRNDERNRWGPLWDWMLFTLYKYDIEGLCGPRGAPYDEYEAEVGIILPRLAKLHEQGMVKHQDVAIILKEVFDQMFCAFPKEKGHAIERFDGVAGAITKFFAGWPFQYGLDDVKDFLNPPLQCP